MHLYCGAAKLFCRPVTKHLLRHYILFFCPAMQKKNFQMIARDFNSVASLNKDVLFKYPSLDYSINSINAIQPSYACGCNNAFVILPWFWPSSRSWRSGLLQAHVKENDKMDRAVASAQPYYFYPAPPLESWVLIKRMRAGEARWITVAN